ncbi:MAG TPA: aldehyde dehydrogenase family protein [Solirubrobacteraceae bacterium]|jgi:succinate-semialdehyde dehydrogenase/glutarate-semialdehyde dehydrogenase|nr:aldehyde dehydrogenase family protein [Solirubrobacteraceae bacterium]
MAVAEGVHESFNPATGESLGRVRVLSPEGISPLVAGVRQVQPLWALLRLEDRARYMRRMAQAVIDEWNDLVDLIAREQGRPPAEVATLELLPALDALIWIADEGAEILGGERVRVHRSMFPVKRASVSYEPLGVVAVIGAGSGPFAQPLTQLAGALLGGNGVVLKPARRAALSGERVAGIAARAGLPEGLVRIVHGGPETGVALAEAAVDKVFFTGSRATGRKVARTCVGDGREVVLQLGGKDAMLVLADAVVPSAVAGALWAGFAAAGQAHGAIERLFVAREVAVRFTAELAAGAQRLTVGDPLLAATDLGPLASPARRAHVDELVQDAIAHGATLRCGGPAAPSGLAGAFYGATVLSEVTPQMRIMRERIGGPVLTVTVVESADEAIALANDCDLALGASVWTADRYRGARIARELRAGMVWLNDHLPSPALSAGPWGGAPRAGLGRVLGESGLRAGTKERLITWDPAGTRGLWWRPYDDSLLRAAHAVARLRSARDRDREGGWRHGAIPMARVAARAWAGRRR